MDVVTEPLIGRRCVVLGGAGFIGKNFCAALIGAHARVVGVDAKPADSLLPNVEWHKIRLQDTKELEALLEPNDIVFHFASSTVPGSTHAPDADVSENLIPSLRLFDACVRSKVSRVVFLSSGGTVYGSDVDVPTSEDAPQNPISWYGVQKLAIEKYLAVYRRLHGLDSIILRISNPFGPHQINPNQGLVGSVVRHALAGTPVEIFGDGGVTRDYIYVADVVSAILRAASLKSGSRFCLYNIGSGIGRSVNEVVAAVQSVCDIPIKINRLPARSVDVPKSILDIKRAAEYLAWRPETRWEDAIRLTYTWAKQQGGTIIAR
jgi:UDP-glucose 4-epimerase